MAHTSKKAVKNVKLAVSRFVDEGNPNTDAVIEQAQGKPSEAGYSSIPDLQLAKDIRKTIRKDQDISVIAKNIRVKVKDKEVTLSGVVFSEQEKLLIAKKVSAVAGEEKVKNRLQTIDEL